MLNIEIDTDHPIVCKRIGSLILHDIQNIGDESVLTAIDYDSGLFLVFSFPSMEQKQQFDLNKVVNLKREARKILPFAFHFHTYDSLFFVKDKSTILLLDKYGEITNQWTNIQFSKNDIYFIPSEESPLFYQDEFLFVGNSTGRISLNSDENRKKYFSSIIPDIIIDIQNNTIYNSTGVFPTNYKRGKGYYDFYPTRLVTDSSIIYSYGVNESVTMYDLKTREFLGNIKLYCNYYENPNVFPDSKLQDFSLIRDYLMSEFRFKKVIWDEKRNLLLRISYLPTEISPDGVKRKMHQNWLLSVYFNKRELLYEYFFNSDQYLPYLYPYKDSYIVLRNTTQNRKNEMIFDHVNLMWNDK